jgi:hypothetical protein
MSDRLNVFAVYIAGALSAVLSLSLFAGLSLWALLFMDDSPALAQSGTAKQSGAGKVGAAGKPAGAGKSGGAKTSHAASSSGSTVQASVQAPDAAGASASTALFAQIADDGLSGTICGGNLQIVKNACAEAHSDPDGKDWSDDVDSGVEKSFKYIDRQTSKILNFAASADTNAEDRARVLYRFGLVLRALEEFYLKSNYVELKMEASPANFDPYNIEPVNWTKVGKDARSIAIAGFKFGQFDKSSVEFPEGGKKLSDATYHSMAKELCVKEAQREWNTVERLIKVRYPQRASEITVALKNATCPANFKPEADE